MVPGIPRAGLRRRVFVGTALLLSLGLAGAGLAAPAASAADATSAVEKHRVDSVKTPKLDWFECAGTGIECATAKVPLDYDQPKGATVELALIRVKARDQKHKIGSLFVNPGGPGGSAADFALFADYWASDAMRDRFDIVGMDPRGIGYSDNVQCFRSFRDQQLAFAKFPGVAFPVTTAENKAWPAYFKALGKACSSSGKPLSAAMSTAQVARDMDVMRRAVGDKKLSYLGFSYGSYLGEVYANMFPDRFRALAIDGVIDPQGWVGTKATANLYTYERVRSAEGSYRSLIELLKRCDRAGGQLCSFAPGDPVKNFDLIAQRLKKKPLTETDPDTGEVFTFSYADMIANTLGLLYYTDGPAAIADMLSQLIILTEPPSNAKVRAASRTNAVKALRASISRLDGKKGPIRAGFPYYNGDDSFYAVQCTDGAYAPKSADDWPAYGNAADKRVKYFGRALAAQGLTCATNTWTATDEDAYRGPFDRATAKPVLVVGSLWDPITNYDSAVKVAKLMPNSRLLTSDNWGHTAQGTSACVDNALDAYLVAGKLPAVGKKCIGDDQPFTEGSDLGEDAASQPALVKAARAAKGQPSPFGRG
ncbi:alpha/beta hydrolase [Microlunatus ginsengisoli]|uniref:Alpha/beta hydrolase n=1 Tax=Microlunatus ginsengisoli TaxID=363863 RepID=A0ABP6ZQJ7_9ACTN